MKKIFLLIALLVLAGCASTSQQSANEKVEAVINTKQWYCGPGLLGLRAVGRFVLSLAGVPIPDLCKAVDAIVESETEQ